MEEKDRPKTAYVVVGIALGISLGFFAGAATVFLGGMFHGFSTYGRSIPLAYYVSSPFAAISVCAYTIYWFTRQT